jgi:glycosyltransferase involved in cell wall biosynthesis
MDSLPDITVIIATRNRLESLRETLQCLDAAGHEGLDVEVIVVENDTEEHYRDIAMSFPNLPVRYLLEPRRGRTHCINRVLDDLELGDIVVLLDDDMSPLGDWFHQVADVCRSHPGHSIFGGRIQPKYPTEDVPNWARHSVLRGLMHSWIDRGPKDIELASDQFPSANHIWFKRVVFSNKNRIRELGYMSGEFTLHLLDRGHRGLWAGGPVALHRIQPELMDVNNLRVRAKTIGRQLPHARMHHYNGVPAAAFSRKHPWLWRLRCVANLGRWGAVWFSQYLTLDADRRIERELMGIVFFLENLERLRLSFWPELSGAPERIHPPKRT